MALAFDKQYGSKLKRIYFYDDNIVWNEIEDSVRRVYFEELKRIDYLNQGYERSMRSINEGNLDARLVFNNIKNSYIKLKSIERDLEIESYERFNRNLETKETFAFRGVISDYSLILKRRLEILENYLPSEKPAKKGFKKNGPIKYISNVFRSAFGFKKRP